MLAARSILTFVFLAILFLNSNFSQLDTLDHPVVQSQEYLKQAAYAFLYNDYDQALLLYKSAKTLDPGNELIDMFIRAVENKIRDVDQVIEYEEDAISAIELSTTQISQLILLLNFEDVTNSAVKQRLSYFNPLYKHLLHGLRMECPSIYFSIDHYTGKNSLKYDFEFDLKTQDALLWLGEKHCDLNEILARKNVIIAEKERDLESKIKYYISALNYKSDFEPSWERLEHLSLEKSFESMKQYFETNEFIDIEHNSIMYNFKEYNTMSPEDLKRLYQNERKQVKKAKNRPWFTLGTSLVLGGAAVLLVSHDETKYEFRDPKNPKKLSLTGKVLDYGGWGLIASALPLATISHQITKKRIKTHKRKMEYLLLFME